MTFHINETTKGFIYAICSAVTINVCLACTREGTIATLQFAKMIFKKKNISSTFQKRMQQI